MTWEEKMDLVVKEVLGDDYKCIVDSDKSFYITQGGKRIIGSEFKYALKSHWRESIVDVLKTLHTTKILNTLSKV